MSVDTVAVALRRCRKPAWLVAALVFFFTASTAALGHAFEPDEAFATGTKIVS